jgi:hypothetical protein
MNAARRCGARPRPNPASAWARLGEGELEVRVEDNHLAPVTLSLLD